MVAGEDASPTVLHDLWLGSSLMRNRIEKFYLAQAGKPVPPKFVMICG
jgi:hypothetical protein